MKICRINLVGLLPKSAYGVVYFISKIILYPEKLINYW
jgi:hypothetical protein